VKFTKDSLVNLHENGDTFDFDAAVGRVKVGFVEGAQVTSGMKVSFGFIVLVFVLF
jgi:hypothetical protein